MDKVSVPPTARSGSRGRLGLSSRMLIGLALGVLLGLFIGEPAGALQPIADVCIRLMQMTVLPYLVLTLIVGPGELDAGAAKRLAWRAGLTFVVPSAAALAGHCASPCLPTVGWAASPPAIVAQTPPVPPAHATGAASAQAAHASAPVEAKASRTLVVRGKVFDLDAPLPVGPRTLPDGHPLLRETALADDRHEFGGRMAPESDTPERRALHDAIVADTVAGVTPQTVPVLYVMAGGGGSGKGFVRARLEATGEIPTRNRVLIDPDEIMERLPEWRLFKDAGDGRAATMLHEESSLLAKRIRALAATRRLDVVLDVALSDAGHARATFEQFRHAGYAIVVFAVATDARVSAAQAADRARQSNRWVPWSVLLEAHRALAAAFEGYARLVDRLSLFDNNGEQPIQIAERDADGGLRVLDVPAYRRWLESSRRINPDATTLGEIYGQTRQ